MWMLVNGGIFKAILSLVHETGWECLLSLARREEWISCKFITAGHFERKYQVSKPRFKNARLLV
jgi:hypothetical protein